MSHDEEKRFLGGLNIHAFMDVYQEWHAFVEGFCEVLCPWPARYNNADSCPDCLKGEYHYYMFGRAIGVIAWLIIAKIIQEAFF